MGIMSIAGLVTLTVASVTGSPNAQPTSGALPELISTRQTYFSIPFQVDAGTNAPRLRQVELWASNDRGANWSLYSTVDPSKLQFLFRAGGDGEFWFTIRTIDDLGQARPERAEQPGLRVAVDTTPPRLQFEATKDPSGQVTARWQVNERSPAVDGLRIQYRAAATDPWQTVPISATSGGVGASDISWWPPTGAAQIEIRAEIADKAGNRDLCHAQVKLADEPASRGSVTDPFLNASNTVPPMNPGGSYANYGGAPSQSGPAAGSGQAPWQPTEPNQPVAPPADPFATNYSGSSHSNDSYSNSTYDASGSQATRAEPSPPYGHASRGTQEESWNQSTSEADSDGSDWNSPSSGNSYGERDNANDSSSYSGASASSTYGTSQEEDDPWSSDAHDSSSNTSYSNSSYSNSSSSDYGSSSHNDYDSSSDNRYGTSTQDDYGSSSETNQYGTSRSDDSGWGAVDEKEESYSSYDDSATSGTEKKRNKRNRSGDSSNRSTESASGRNESRSGSGYEADYSSHGTESSNRASSSWEAATESANPSGGSNRSVRIVSVRPGQGSRQDRMTIRWETMGPRLAGNAVTLSYSTSPYGPWATIAEKVMNSGQYAWQPGPGTPSPVHVRIEIAEPSGNVIANDTPQPVRLPTTTPSRSWEDETSNSEESYDSYSGGYNRP